jgi:hypothetical protein
MSPGVKNRGPRTDGKGWEESEEAEAAKRALETAVKAAALAEERTKAAERAENAFFRALVKQQGLGKRIASTVKLQKVRLRRTT